MANNPADPKRLADLAAEAAQTDNIVHTAVLSDAGLRALDLNADRIVTQQISIAGGKNAGKAVTFRAPIISTEVMGALKCEGKAGEAKGMALMRLVRVLDSQEMRDAWAERDPSKALWCMTKHNLLVAFIELYGINITVREIGDAMERYISKMVGAARYVPWANVAAGILLLASSLVWQGCTGQLTMNSAAIELVKAAGVVLMPLTAYVGFHSIFNSTVPIFADNVAAGKTYRAAAGAALYSYFAQLPVVGWFFRPTPILQVDEIDEAYPNAFVHDSFVDPISLELLKDPVFLHGRPWERSSITRALAEKPENPLTRAPARLIQLAVPPAEYVRLLTEYTAERRRIMRAIQARAAAPPTAE